MNVQWCRDKFFENDFHLSIFNAVTRQPFRDHRNPRVSQHGLANSTGVIHAKATIDPNCFPAMWAGKMPFIAGRQLRSCKVSGSPFAAR